MSTSNSVPKLYKSVIEDVIKNVRESFLNEGVDEQVLQELKTIWESKLLQSRAVDGMPTDVQQQAMRTQYLYPHSQHVTAIAVPPKRPQATMQNRIIPQGALQRVQTTQLTQPLITQNQGRMLTPAQLQSARVVQQSQPRSSVVVPEAVTPQQAASGQTAIMYPSAHTHVLGQMTPAASTATMAVQGMPHIQHVTGSQVTVGYPTAKTIQTAPRVQQMQHQQHQRVVVPQDGSNKQPTVFIQVDGANDSGSDDDDDDDDDDDEDDPSASKSNLDGEENEDDDDPLNSADDVSDDDQSDMFDTDNVVVCQYDKIARSRNKWKFHLKDGIMNLRGRDYVFQKATGEAEW